MLQYPRTHRRFEDLWFRSDRPLLEIADALEPSGTVHDHENYWEWVIGRLAGHEIDITRAHGQPAGEVDTRVFLVGRHSIGESLAEQLVQGLRPLVAGSIKCGRWVYRKGNEFDKLVEREFPL
jgi:hypothetical protein